MAAGRVAAAGNQRIAETVGFHRISIVSAIAPAITGCGRVVFRRKLARQPHSGECDCWYYAHLLLSQQLTDRVFDALDHVRIHELIVVRNIDDIKLGKRHFPSRKRD